MWRYARRFRADGHDVRVLTDVGMESMDTHVEVDGVRRATDRLLMSAEPYRNNRLAVALPSGRTLEVEAGYNSMWNVGMRAAIDGQTVWESHPGRAVAPPPTVARMLEGQSGTGGQAARMKTQWPSIAVDIGLALMFFLVAKLTDLRTAALVAAGAGLALVVVQRFVKVDLLGGMALFGILMTLLGAVFAILFEDEVMIQLRSTVLGGIAAALFLTDGALGGRYLGKRMMLYLPGNDIDPRRLALAFGATGLGLALVNLLVVKFATKDQWLVYTTFLDMPLAIGGVLLAMRLARRPAQPA